MPKKIWGKEDVDFLIKNYSELDMDLLMKELGKTKEQLQSKAKLLGLKRNKSLDNKRKKLNEYNHIFINEIEYKICKTCKQYLTLDSFSSHKQTFDSLNTSCKECVKSCTKKSIENNKDKVKEYQKNYRNENKEKLSQYSKEWQEKNVEKANEIRKKSRLKNAESRREYARNYSKTNRGKEIHRFNENKRRNKKKNLINNLTHKEWEETISHWSVEGEICCAYCGKKADKIHQEHIIPLSKGGGFTKNNIIPACEKCNLSKNNKDIDSFFIYCDDFTEENYLKIINFIKSTSANGGVLL